MQVLTEVGLATVLIQLLHLRSQNCMGGCVKLAAIGRGYFIFVRLLCPVNEILLHWDLFTVDHCDWRALIVLISDKDLSWRRASASGEFWRPALGSIYVRYFVRVRVIVLIEIDACIIELERLLLLLLLFQLLIRALTLVHLSAFACRKLDNIDVGHQVVAWRCADTLSDNAA